ncbi:MAG: large conductance mechanosensitive channel protein MscL [Pyrinomonadaceae bacterium]
MLKEFKTFIMQGNVVELAIALVIGAAFGKIITSFVEDVLMPPIGLLLGHVDFSTLFINLSGKAYASLAEAKAAGAPTINYGQFLNTVVMFLIVAFAIFMMIKALNKTKKPKAEGPATVKDCQYCLTSIPVNATRCGHCTSELLPIAGIATSRG